MKSILDTHFFLWWLLFPEKLSLAEIDFLSDPVNTIFISAVSVWEINIKKSQGKLEVPDNIHKYIKDNDFIPLSVTSEHASLIINLPLHHADPFDRMLIAQAKAEGALLLSRDKKIHIYAAGTAPGLPAALRF